MEPDFSGYVTKANLQCTDGRTIAPGAFKHQDGARVPVVYNHNHNDIAQHLGYAVLSHREDGVWGDIFLNKDNVNSVTAANLVKQGALDKFSIWAKNLMEEGALVHSGDIQEVSLVLAGANPGASVYNVLMHSDVDQDDLMVVGGEIVHSDTEAKDAPPAKDDDAPSGDDAPAGEKSVADVLDSLTDEQKLAVNATIDDIVTEAVTEALTEENLNKDESGTDAGNSDDLQHSDSQKGTQMTSNAFEKGQAVGDAAKPELKHSDVQSVLAAAKGGDIKEWSQDRSVSSLRDLVRSPRGGELMHADTYGIDNMEVLFPDAQALMARPTFVDRRQDWVKTWMSGTSHSPFSRVKTTYADITADEARARGYIKGNQKTEEVFPVFRRETGPAWVIKKQRLDRQDIIDIKDFDVVAWMKAEMRGKLDEEVARAGLFGDGRPSLLPDGTPNPDKIQDPGANANSGNGIRAVVNDHELYTTRYEVPLDVNVKGQAWNGLLDAVTEAGEFYLGSGNKTAFMPFKYATRLLTIRDDWGKRIYRNLDEVAGDMDVNRIVRVPTELFPDDVLCIVLDMSDYNYGTDRGGEVTLFDDFDINFNQYHYLIETYLSGALTLPYCAQVFIRVDADELQAIPVKPGFNAQTSTVTIPTTTGVNYTNAETGTVLSAGPYVVTKGNTLIVEAIPQDGFYFGTGDDDRYDSWSFESTQVESQQA